MSFSGKELIQGEPDASSFPSGGLRATFEARGYTAWDPTSYAFVKDEVLCIPTAFCSLHRRGARQEDAASALHESPSTSRRTACSSCSARAISSVVTTVGAEQEYFLISEKDYAKRLDLVLTRPHAVRRMPPCKGQELEEHYFGAIRPTVNEFMKELDDELWKLGVSAQDQAQRGCALRSTSSRRFSRTRIAPSTRTCSRWRR